MEVSVDTVKAVSAASAVWSPVLSPVHQWLRCEYGVDVTAGVVALVAMLTTRSCCPVTARSTRSLQTCWPAGMVTVFAPPKVTWVLLLTATPVPFTPTRTGPRVVADAPKRFDSRTRRPDPPTLVRATKRQVKFDVDRSFDQRIDAAQLAWGTSVVAALATGAPPGAMPTRARARSSPAHSGNARRFMADLRGA